MRTYLFMSLTGIVFLAACNSSAPSGTPTSAPTSPSPPGVGVRTNIDYPAGSLAAFLAADERFSTFLALMEQDGILLDRLLADQAGSFTLFVPTNEAFERLSPAAWAALVTDPSAITGIVERHFLTRRLAADGFASAYVYAGMSRRYSRLALVVDGQRIWFGDARVIETDLQVAGGIVHVIDGVNLGPTPDRRPIP